MGASNRGPSCESCYSSPEECMGCNGYPAGTTFRFQGESEPPIIESPDKSKRVQDWIRNRMSRGGNDD